MTEGGSAPTFEEFVASRGRDGGAACPDVLPESGPLPDLSDVTVLRFCAAGFNGFPAEPGPPDALVTGIARFSAAVAGLPEADPARCAAIHVIPTDSRLLLQLADGTALKVPSGS